MLVKSVKKMAIPPKPYSISVLRPTTSIRNAWKGVRGREKGEDEEGEGGRKGREEGKR